MDHLEFLFAGFAVSATARASSCAASSSSSCERIACTSLASCAVRCSSRCTSA